jgi:Rieske Fe-S protein
MNRRELLKSWQALAGAVAALAAYPTAHFWWRSSRIKDPSTGAWSDLGPPVKIDEGSWQRRALTVERRNRWRVESREETVYVRRSGEQLQVVSAVCPHTGCLVRTEGSGFTCPCHHSLFDAEGRSVEGPSPRPLDRLEWKLERGRLKVRYQRFRPGLAEAQPLSA